MSYTRTDHMTIDEARVVADLIEDSDDARKQTMIDIGAHHGSALAPMALRNWDIHAFEPDPDNRAFLRDRFQDAPNVRIDSRAVSNRTGSGAAFFQSPASTGISSLHPFHPSHRQIGTVQTTTLSDYCREQQVRTVDYLKIDTEGHDLFVLEGFNWDEMRPHVVLCEFEDKKTVPLGYDFNDLADFLLERNFQLWVSEWHPIVRYGQRHDWSRLVKYPYELLHLEAWGNILAFAEPVSESRMLETVRRRSSGP